MNSVLVTLHAPNGAQHHIREAAVISVHPPLANSPQGTGALIYLSNGMQWSVRETVAEVMKLIHG